AEQAMEVRRRQRRRAHEDLQVEPVIEARDDALDRPAYRLVIERPRLRLHGADNTIASLAALDRDCEFRVRAPVPLARSRSRPRPPRAPDRLRRSRPDTSRAGRPSRTAPFSGGRRRWRGACPATRRALSDAG